MPARGNEWERQRPEGLRPLIITRALYTAVSGPAGPRNLALVSHAYHADDRSVRTGIDPATQIDLHHPHRTQPSAVGCRGRPR